MIFSWKFYLTFPDLATIPTWLGPRRNWWSSWRIWPDLTNYSGNLMRWPTYNKVTLCVLCVIRPWHVCVCPLSSSLMNLCVTSSLTKGTLPTESGIRNQERIQEKNEKYSEIEAQGLKRLLGKKFRQNYRWLLRVPSLSKKSPRPKLRVG